MLWRNASRNIATRSAGVPGAAAKARPIASGSALIDMSDLPSALVARSSSVGRFSNPGTGVRPRTSGRTAPRSAASLIVVPSADHASTSLRSMAK